MTENYSEKFESDSPERTESIAGNFAMTLKPPAFVALNGPLGAGKTKFSSGIIRFFCGNLNPTSPTFSIMNRYSCMEVAINHFDFYRLKTVLDLENCGFFDSLSGENITIAEWTDIIGIDYKKFAEKGYYTVNIDIKTGGKEGNEKRFIKIEKIL